MDLQLILSFIGASILLTLMPGPDILLVITESITNGRKNGVALATGLSSGVLIHTIAAATGLSLIIQNSAFAFQVLKYAGALYLLYLAILTIKDSSMPTIEKGGKEQKQPFLKLVRQGFIMNVLNPKVSLFFIAFLPQFVKEGSLSFSTQMMILGGIFMVQALIIFSLVAFLAGRLSPYLNSPTFWKTTKWGKASVLGILAILLAVAEK